MIKFAFVAANGEITSTVCPSEDGMFSDGQVVDNQTMRSFDYTEDDTHVIENWYWRDGWVKTKPPRPSMNHYWDNYQWNLDTVALMKSLREQRDYKLADSDWRLMPDSPMNAEQRESWATYRQALRDVPDNNATIQALDEVVWPSPPQ